MKTEATVNVFIRMVYGNSYIHYGMLYMEYKNKRASLIKTRGYGGMKEIQLIKYAIPVPGYPVELLNLKS